MIKVKCEIIQASVMTNLYVHSTYAKQVIVLNVVDGQTDAHAAWQQ